MTQAPWHKFTGQGAVFPRLIVLLAFMVFGPPQGHAGGIAPNAGSAAQSEVEQAQAHLSAQRQVLRAQLVDDNTPDAALLGVAVKAKHRALVGIIPAPHLAFVPFVIRILPSVRGPPAA